MESSTHEMIITTIGFGIVRMALSHVTEVEDARVHRSVDVFRVKDVNYRFGWNVQ
jgi:hypothetical protein